METTCPICNQIIRDEYNFCPSCGLPKRITTKRRLEYKLPDSNAHLLVNTRPEFSPYNIFDYQICDLCGSPNPFGAKYCRECGISIEFQAKDKNGHGWVDLGLSVLWSTETITGLYLWNHSELELSTSSNMNDIHRVVIDNKDIATAKWGSKWRTPTKDEFEELMKKCTWKKIFLPASDTLALCVTGPNGNSITIPVTGHAGCTRLDNICGYKPENKYSECCFWTSSEYISPENNNRTQHSAYGFSIIGYSGYNGYDGNGRKLTEKEALRDRIDLWLKTPIKFNYNLEDKSINTIRRMPKMHGCAIRPVADMKWKGKL